MADKTIRHNADCNIMLEVSDSVVIFSGYRGDQIVDNPMFHESFGTDLGNKLRRALFNYIVRKHG